jgi:uncharacterized SAM-binding protein YcdF (DUF218 family)
MQTLMTNNLSPGRLLLVAKPFLMRRCLATFSRQFPEVQTFACPPEGTFETFIDRPVREFVERLAAEVDRLKRYCAQGFISPVAIPVEVEAAVQLVRDISSWVG